MKTKVFFIFNKNYVPNLKNSVAKLNLFRTISFFFRRRVREHEYRR